MSGEIGNVCVFFPILFGGLVAPSNLFLSILNILKAKIGCSLGRKMWF